MCHNSSQDTYKIFVRTYVCTYVRAASTQHTTHQGTHYTSKTSLTTKAKQGTTLHPSLKIDLLELRLRLTSFGRVGKPSKSVPFRSPSAARYQVLLAVWSTSGALADQTPSRSSQGQGLRQWQQAQVDCDSFGVILLDNRTTVAN